MSWFDCSSLSIHWSLRYRFLVLPSYIFQYLKHIFGHISSCQAWQGKQYMKLHFPGCLFPCSHLSRLPLGHFFLAWKDSKSTTLFDCSIHPGLIHSLTCSPPPPSVQIDSIIIINILVVVFFPPPPAGRCCKVQISPWHPFLIPHLRLWECWW